MAQVCIGMQPRSPVKDIEISIEGPESPALFETLKSFESALVKSFAARAGCCSNGPIGAILKALQPQRQRSNVCGHPATKTCATIEFKPHQMLRTAAF